jgi:hypothetical protein
MDAATRERRTPRRMVPIRATLALVAVVAITMLGFAAPSMARTASFDANFKEGFEGAAPSKPCPTGGIDPCGVGRIKGIGVATERFELGPVVEGNPCSAFTGTTTMTLPDGSTLVIAEVDTECTPGNSTNTPGSELHAFGNPVIGKGTWTVTSGTGVFAGATGAGTTSYVGSGDALVIHYLGSVQLP